MHIVLLFPTFRGRLILEKLIDLVPEAELTVFTIAKIPGNLPFRKTSKA